MTNKESQQQIIKHNSKTEKKPKKQQIPKHKGTNSDKVENTNAN